MGLATGRAPGNCRQGPGLRSPRPGPRRDVGADRRRPGAPPASCLVRVVTDMRTVLHGVGSEECLRMLLSESGCLKGVAVAPHAKPEFVNLAGVTESL